METDQAVNSASFKVNNFEGSLDLLLQIIRENGINIYDIPIASITDQYLSYLDYIPADLDNLTEFYALAATLLCIKSRMLLPVEEAEIDGEGEIGDPRQELVEQLIEYQKYKKLSDLMSERESETEWVMERKKLQRSLPFEEDNLWERADTWDLMRTFSGLMSKYHTQVIYDLYEEVSVNEKLTLMNELLEEKGECMFTDLIVRKGNLMDIVCAFMAILEAVKFRTASIWQNRMFGDIKIKRWQPHPVEVPDEGV